MSDGLKVGREVNVTTLVKRIEALEARVTALEKNPTEEKSLWERVFGVKALGFGGKA